jgi:CheY-specific phosphatase CheX
MTDIWGNDGSGWSLLPAVGFPDEATLHGLVQEAPQLLPLSGTPRMTVLGREVTCGTGSADLVGIETSGRVVLIEVKLANNAEARRAVVAQLLSYAAFIKGDTVEDFDNRLAKHLAVKGFSTVAEAVAEADQEGSFDATEFRESLAANLASGAFRLAFVLDSAPPDLVRVVGYLESMSSAALVIDLITVSAYEVAGTKVLVPQRVDPEHTTTLAGSVVKTAPSSVSVEGSTDFVAAIANAAPDDQQELTRLADWAVDLEKHGLAKLFTSHGKGRKTLVAWVNGGNAGLVTIWNDNGPYIQLFRSVFERLAPEALAKIEQLGQHVGQGSSVRHPSDELLGILASAYEEAVGNKQHAGKALP